MWPSSTLFKSLSGLNQEFEDLQRDLMMDFSLKPLGSEIEVYSLKSILSSTPFYLSWSSVLLTRART